MSAAAARQALDAAVEHAYAVFSGYRPGREQVSVCRCPLCIEPDSEFELLNLPLREIDYFALADYTYAGNVEGDPGFDPDELRYSCRAYLHSSRRTTRRAFPVPRSPCADFANADIA